jgi:hypothetical protein
MSKYHQLIYAIIVPVLAKLDAHSNVSLAYVQSQM